MVSSILPNTNKLQFDMVSSNYSYFNNSNN